MKVSIVVAMSQNRVIGKNNSLPWHIPEDLKHFKDITLGHHVLMGRKTFESIGRPLINRVNLILSNSLESSPEGCTLFSDIENAIDFAKENGENELMIMGGEQIYSLALSSAEKIYLTRILRDYEGDAYFPEIAENDWVEVNKESHLENNPPFEIVSLERRL